MPPKKLILVDKGGSSPSRPPESPQEAQPARPPDYQTRGGGKPRGGWGERLSRLLDAVGSALDTPLEWILGESVRRREELEERRRRGECRGRQCYEDPELEATELGMAIFFGGLAAPAALISPSAWRGFIDDVRNPRKALREWREWFDEDPLWASGWTAGGLLSTGLLPLPKAGVKAVSRPGRVERFRFHMVEAEYPQAGHAFRAGGTPLDAEAIVFGSGSPSPSGKWLARLEAEGRMTMDAVRLAAELPRPLRRALSRVRRRKLEKLDKLEYDVELPGGRARARVEEGPGYYKEVGYGRAGGREVYYKAEIEYEGGRYRLRQTVYDPPAQELILEPPIARRGPKPPTPGELMETIARRLDIPVERWIVGLRLRAIPPKPKPRGASLYSKRGLDMKRDKLGKTRANTSGSLLSEMMMSSMLDPLSHLPLDRQILARALSLSPLEMEVQTLVPHSPEALLYGLDASPRAVMVGSLLQTKGSPSPPRRGRRRDTYSESRRRKAWLYWEEVYPLADPVELVLGFRVLPRDSYRVENVGWVYG